MSCFLRFQNFKAITSKRKNLVELLWLLQLGHPPHARDQCRFRPSLSRSRICTGESPWKLSLNETKGPPLLAGLTRNNPKSGLPFVTTQSALDAAHLTSPFADTVIPSTSRGGGPAGSKNPEPAATGASVRTPNPWCLPFIA